MAELCSPPKAKGDALLDENHVAVAVGANGGPSSASVAPKNGTSFSVLSVAWLTFTTMMAIAGLIMAAWATWKVRNLDLPLSGVALVENPSDAANNNYRLLGNLYRGTGYWSIRAQMAYARSDHGAAAYNGSIYVFGGQSFDPALNSTKVLSSMSKYNMFLNTVEEMPSMPEPRYRFGYAVLNDKLYVFGGWKGFEGTDQAAPSTSTMIFSFKTKAWDNLDSRSPQTKILRTDVAGAAANNKVYATGGYDPTNYNTLTIVEVLDPATGEWSTVPNMSVSRGDHAAVAVKDMIYVMGGITTIGQGNCDDWYSCHPWIASAEVFDTKAGRWSKLANMTYARGDFSVEALSNGHILVAGGENGYSNGGLSLPNLVAQPWVEEYMPEYDTWILKAPLSEPRFRFDMASDDGNFVYAFGGAQACPNGNEECNRKALSTVLGYFDDKYPSVWVAKP